MIPFPIPLITPEANVSLLLDSIDSLSSLLTSGHNNVLHCGGYMGE